MKIDSNKEKQASEGVEYERNMKFYCPVRGCLTVQPIR